IIATLLTILHSADSRAGRPSGGEAWAEALSGALEQLDPIAAAQIQGLHPEIRFEPGLMRIRGIDSRDENQLAALDPMFRFLASKGYTAHTLKDLRIGETSDPETLRGLSRAYRAGLAHAVTFSDEVEASIEGWAPEETTVESFRAVQNQLRALESIY